MEVRKKQRMDVVRKKGKMDVGRYEGAGSYIYTQKQIKDQSRYYSEEKRRVPRHR
jgi:hypothetical protein